MDKYAGSQTDSLSPVPQNGADAAPTGRSAFGWFAVLHYARGKRTHIIEGTDTAISPQTYKVLERLAAHGSGSLLTPSELQKLFSESPHATVLASKALGDLENIFKKMFPDLADRMLERAGRAGARLFTPADLDLAAAPTPQIITAKKPRNEATPEPAEDPRPKPPQLPALKRAFRAADLQYIAARDMVINGLYQDPSTEGWFVFAGETDASAMEEDAPEGTEDGDDVLSPAPAMRRLARIRLDGEEAGQVAFEAPAALRVDAVSAYRTLRSAHRRMIELMNAAEILAALYNTPKHPVRLAADVNSGDPVRIASALAQATIYLRKPLDPTDLGGFSQTPYRILHRRAMAILARYNALVNDVPFEQALRPLAKAMSADTHAPVPQLHSLYPYHRPAQAHQPVYDAGRHGAAQKPLAVHHYEWFAIEEYDRHFGRYRVAGDTASLRPDAFRLLKTLYRRRGDFVSREALQAALYPDSANPEAALNNALALLRSTLAPVLKKHDKTADDVILTGRSRGLRFMLPDESWIKPTPEPKAPQQPAVETSILSLGHFDIEIAQGVKRMGIRIAGSNRYLSPGEFAYLEHLYERAGQWVTRRESAAELFPDNAYGESRIHILVDSVANKLADAFGKDKAAAIFATARGAGCCLAAKGEALPPPPAAAEQAAAGRVTETRDYGHFKIVVIEGAINNPAHFEGTGISLSGKELALLDFLHEHAGKWVLPAQITRHLYGARENAQALAFSVVQSFAEKIEEALGTQECAAIFARMPRLGMALARPGENVPPLPPRVHVRFAEQVQAKANGNGNGHGQPLLHYHPSYGPGYDLGEITRSVMGADMVFRRFLPLTDKEPRDQAEVLLGQGSGMKGYGLLDMDAYRAALRAGFTDLRNSIETGLYDGPPIPAVSAALKNGKSPAVMIPLLASFIFYLPTSKDGSGALRTQMERIIARNIALAYPHITLTQALQHMTFLQTWPRKLGSELVFPFESAEKFAAASAQADVLLAAERGGRKNNHSLSGRFTPQAGNKRIVGNSEPTFDVAAFTERRMRLHPSLIAG